MKNVTLYTDGACKGNPGPGGWAAILIYQTTQKQLFGSEPETTNNRMELTAAVQGLEALKAPCSVKLYTDSKYVKDGIENWIHNWVKNHWKTSNKSDVKNKDLWQRLYTQSHIHHLQLFWVKGHSGDPLNELADQLANKAIEENKQ